MSTLKCGFSQAVITPGLNGTFLDGYGFRLTPAEKINDDLYAKACVFEWQGARFALIALDICGLNQELLDIIRFHISQISGIPKEKMAVCATHTHSGPACGVLSGLPLNYDYWNHVGELAGFAVKDAFEKASRGKFVFSASAACMESSFNRRGRDIIDRSIRTAAFCDENNDLKGVLASASCHPVINTGMGISADYPSVLTKEAEKSYPGVPFLFLQGRGADINPHFAESLSIEAAVDRLGHELSGGVLEAIGKRGAYEINFDGSCIVKSAYDEIEIPMQNYPGIPELNQAVASLCETYYAEKDSFRKHCVFRELVWHKTALAHAMKNDAAVLRIPLQILTLSDSAAFVMLPFELLTLTGNKIEKYLTDRGYRPESIFIIGYANGTNGYLMPEEEVKYGGYEALSAPHWYNIPLCSEETERAVLKHMYDMAGSL